MHEDNRGLGLVGVLMAVFRLLGVLGVQLGVAVRVTVRVRSYEPPLPGWFRG